MLFTQCLRHHCRRAAAWSGVPVVLGASALALLLFALPVQAQTSPAAASSAAAKSAPDPVLEGTTLDGKPFTLASLKGKAVLLMFWSTGCAVCRDKMPELRNNYAGWAGKPFEVVAVNLDRNRQDFDDYERIMGTTVPLKQRFVQIWGGDKAYKDNIAKPRQQPYSLLIDKTGKVVDRYTGRIPAEAWDKIADLL